jgi:hypothetical protein
MATLTRVAWKMTLLSSLRNDAYPLPGISYHGCRQLSAAYIFAIRAAAETASTTRGFSAWLKPRLNQNAWDDYMLVINIL